MRLIDIDGRVLPQTIRFSTDMASLRHCNLIVFSVKSTQTEEAAKSLLPVLSPEATILSLQNGVRNGALIKAILPKARILRGMVLFNIVWRGSSHLHRATERHLAVEDDPRLDVAARSFLDAGLPLDRRTDLEAVQWAKLLLNLNNAINALSGLPLRKQLEDRSYRQCLAMAQREALAVLKNEGRIRPARLMPLPASWMPALLRLPDPLFRPLAGKMLKIDETARSSMADDLRAGRPTEVDWINGEVVRLAQRIGQSAPVNVTLCALVHAATKGTQPLSAGDLLNLLGKARSPPPGHR